MVSPKVSAIVPIAGQHYRKAPWSQRIMARVIDLVLLSVGCAMAGAPFTGLVGIFGLIYFLVGDALFGGATAGKRLLRIKVIDARHGGPPTFFQDLLRHRYLFFFNFVFLALTAYDTARGDFDTPEVWVVCADPVSPPQPEKTPGEKPAKLDLAGMRETLQQIRNEHADPSRRS